VAIQFDTETYIVKPFNPSTVMNKLDKIAAQIHAQRAAGKA